MKSSPADNKRSQWHHDADQHLLSIIKDGLEPLCIQITADFVVRNYWGNPELFQLSDLEIGKSANSLAFLVGLEAVDEPITLKFLQVSAAHVAHVHIYKHEQSLFVTLFDVTDDHNYIQPIQQGANEAQLKGFYDQQLIAKLERTQEELNNKKAEIEEISQSKSRFIASMSHEFRTPITSIIGYAEILQKKISSADSSLDSLAIIRRNAHFLLNMVNNILDEARLESGDIEVSVSEVDIRDTLTLIEHMFIGLAEQKGLEFAIDIDANVPQFLLVDELRLQQMLVNLVGNAIKFTVTGSVKLHVYYADNFAYFAIVDTGVGISQDNQSKIFQPFQRLENQQQGAGLGLSITQYLLEMMGGRLQLQSEEGKGSTFTLSLPCETIDLIQSEPVNFQQQHIFIVEDNQDIAELISIFLAEMGMSPEVISDGLHAEKRINEQQPDLVMMDLNLPNRNGLDITRSLRDNGYVKPIIAFSAAGLLASKEQALAMGCDDYIDKANISPARLRKVLTRYLTNVSITKPEFSSKLNALKDKYRSSLAQKLMVIESTWRSCQTNHYDKVACKMLYTLTHNLAGSAGSYEFDDISQCAQAVNACIDTAYKVVDADALENKVLLLIKTLEKYQ